MFSKQIRLILVCWPLGNDGHSQLLELKIVYGFYLCKKQTKPDLVSQRVFLFNFGSHTKSFSYSLTNSLYLCARASKSNIERREIRLSQKTTNFNLHVTCTPLEVSPHPCFNLIFLYLIQLCHMFNSILNCDILLLVSDVSKPVTINQIIFARIEPVLNIDHLDTFIR